MIEKDDVVKELEVKNREIYLNKLDMDLGSNLELLKLTTTNFINISISEVISAILNIEGSFINKDYIEPVVTDFFKTLNIRVNDLYQKRNNYLMAHKEDEQYASLIDKKIVDSIVEYYHKNIDSFMSSLNKGYSDFEKERLASYMNGSFYDKYVRRFNDIVSNANMILLNNYYESKERLALINSKTLKDICN